MAYEFQTDAFEHLLLAMREHPGGIPKDTERGHILARLYLKAAYELFRLMKLIMLSRLQQSEQGPRYMGFIEIYDGRVQALLEALEAELFQTIHEKDSEFLFEFLEGVRQSALADEMVALQSAIDSSSGTGGDAAADENGTTTVTNSLKEQIERRVKFKYVKDILHAINEVLAVARGAS